MSNQAGGPTPIPPIYAQAIAGTSQQRLDELSHYVSAQLVAGRPDSEIVQEVSRSGWDVNFVQWYVGVYAAGGFVSSLPPPQAFAAYPREAPNLEGNFWDKQSVPYRKGGWALWFHVFCCQCIGILVACLLMIFCKTEEGKQNGKRLFYYSLAGIGVGIVVRVFIEVLVSLAGH